MRFYDVIDENYFKEIIILIAHHSTAIEGNTLTLEETRQIINNNTIHTTKEVSIRDIYEIDNYKNMLYYLNENYPLDIQTIKLFHSILTNNTLYNAGFFKTEENTIGGNLTTHPSKVLDAMYQFVENLRYRLNIAKTNDEKLEIISETHIDFEKIHPFTDGNGRVGRFLMLYIAIKENIIPFIIKKEDRSQYINYLKNEDVEGLTNYLKELQEIEIKRVEKMYNVKINEQNNNKKFDNSMKSML